MSSNRGGYRSRFGDTTLTKVFVGGLAWETPSDKLRGHFERYGEILEAVVITDKSTGRSKGYGFVTFREPESARQACVEPNPIIDGRRANCNIASQGLSTPSPPPGRNQIGGNYPQYNRMQPSSQMYPPWYMTYPADYGYHQQQGLYNQQNLLAAQYQNQIYAQSRMGGAYAYMQPVGYSMPSAPVRAGMFPINPQIQRMQMPDAPTYAPYQVEEGGDEGSIIRSSFNEREFQLEAPPTTIINQTQDTPSVSETPQSPPPQTPPQQKHGEQEASTNGEVTETAANTT